MTTKQNKGNDELAKMLANPKTRALLLAMLEQQQPVKQAKASKAAKPAPVEKVQVVNYSEKAVAVIGNTKPLKDTLKNFGRFNPFLRVEGKTTPGWIVSIKRRDDLKKTLIELGAL